MSSATYLFGRDGVRVFLDAGVTHFVGTVKRCFMTVFVVLRCTEPCHLFRQTGGESSVFATLRFQVMGTV